jgi:uncharacterized protein
MFKRDLMHTFKERLAQFPVVALTGPRQSGKTTLLELFVDDYDYLNLELPEHLQRLQLDPKAILQKATTSKGLIIDEAQQYPEVFSYIQVIADQAKKKGQFILSGSQNFLLNQQITQSLAGRAAILELLPLTYHEYLTHPDLQELSLWQWLFQGAYPRPYQDRIPSNVWMNNYIRTYLERDVRDLLKVRDLNLFQQFLRFCAGRHGQLLNTKQLSIDCGVSHTTIMNWLSILEASYIIFRLPPYHKNFNKRLIKSPKLYFYDSGLVSFLLGVDSADHLSVHSARGAIFEGYVISEIKKYFDNLGVSVPIYFWRDSHGDEVDCIIEYKGQMLAIEIKSTSTFRKDLLKNLLKWQRISESKAEDCRLIYAGEEKFNLMGIQILSWEKIASVFNTQ